MKKCHKCGHQVDNKQVFCNNCDEKLEVQIDNVEGKSETLSKGSKWKKKSFLLGGLLIILVAVVYVYISNFKNPSPSIEDTAENINIDQETTNASEVKGQEVSDSSSNNFDDFNGYWSLESSEGFDAMSIAHYVYISDDFFIKTNDFEELEVHQIKNKLLEDGILTVEMQDLSSDTAGENNQGIIELQISGGNSRNHLRILNVATEESTSFTRNKEISEDLKIENHAKEALAAYEKGIEQGIDQNMTSTINEEDVINELFGNSYVHTYENGELTYTFHEEWLDEEGPILYYGRHELAEWDGEIHSRVMQFNILDIRFEDNIYYITLSELYVDSEMVFEFYRASENELLRWDDETNDYTQSYIRQ